LKVEITVVKVPAFFLCAILLLSPAVAQQRDLDPKYINKNIDIGSVATAPSCTDTVDYARLLCLTQALKQLLSPELASQLQLPYAVESAKKWSNFPPIGFPDRVGPILSNFSTEQLSLVKAILKQASGIAQNEGYDELEQVLNADDFLIANTNDAKAGFSSGNYHIAFLGDPSETGLWQLYFGGHHFALTSTYSGGKLVGATPSFRGVEPFTSFDQNGRSNAPLVQEQAAFAAMLEGLSEDERKMAKLSQTYTNIIAGPQKDDAIPSVREGLKAGGLSSEKQALIVAAIETYVTDIDPVGAKAIMEKYKSELAETYIAYSGTAKMNSENDYVRIDGPSVWIEWSMQPGRSIPGVHPHSIWRDRTSDYGGNK
jgi:hypothetical protein